MGGTALAPALFAGCGDAPHAEGCGVQGLGEVAHFDAATMRAAAAALSPSRRTLALAPRAGGP